MEESRRDISNSLARFNIIIGYMSNVILDNVIDRLSPNSCGRSDKVFRMNSHIHDRITQSRSGLIPKISITSCYCIRSLVRWV
jgi:hypothetical protein